MSAQLIALRDALSRSLEELLDERDRALATVPPDLPKVNTAQAEAERIGIVISTVQFAINKSEALNLTAVADRLQESIEAQRAVGLATAPQLLEKTVQRLRNAVAIGPGPVSSAGNGQGNSQPGQTIADIQAKPGPFQDVVNRLIAGAKAQQLDPMTVLTIVAIESDFKSTATSPLSSAGGLFQFLDSTWSAAGGTQVAGRGGIGNGHAAAAPIEEQIAIGCKFIAQNVKDLTAKLGSTPSRTAIYMAHQQGLTGALKILQADMNTPIEAVIGDDAARNNRLNGLTAAQAIAKFRTLVRSNEDEANALVVITGASDGGQGPIATNGAGPKLADIALSEMEMFARRNTLIVPETEPPLRSRVLEYFNFVGRSDITDPTTEPWSAAFISFIFHRAGVSQELFPKSANHAKYILAGLANRMNNRINAPIVYFDRDETAPRVGDLVGFSRTHEVKSRRDMETFLPNRFFPSHTDLVIDVSGGKLKLIGGNVSQTIMTKTIKTDPHGKIDQSEEHFFVLRMNV
jgi:hypothetical protein